MFGELDGTRSPRAERLLSETKAAGIDAEIADDIHAVLWSKYLFLCAAAGITAAARLPLDVLLGVSETRELFRRIAGEVAALASAEGVALPDDVVDQALSLAETFGPGTFSSLHHDLTTGASARARRPVRRAHPPRRPRPVAATRQLGRVRATAALGDRAAAGHSLDPPSSMGELADR